MLCLRIVRGVIAGVLDLGCGSGARRLRQAGSLRYSRLEICATGLVFGVAVDTFEVGFELSGPNSVLVFEPGVFDVPGRDACGEATEARGEVEQASDVGDAEMFLALSLVEFESFAGQGEALVVKLPFLVAKGFGAFGGEFLIWWRRFWNEFHAGSPPGKSVRFCSVLFGFELSGSGGAGISMGAHFLSMRAMRAP